MMEFILSTPSPKDLCLYPNSMFIFTLCLFTFTDDRNVENKVCVKVLHLFCFWIAVVWTIWENKTLEYGLPFSEKKSIEKQSSKFK